MTRSPLSSIVTFALSAIELAGLAPAQATYRVSVKTGGAQAAGSNTSPSVTPDGRFVAFVNDDNDLVSGDTNGVSDAFVHDRQAGTTERVSINTSGAQGNGASLSVGLSANGRYVVFISWASNLIVGDTNARPDIFVRDRQSGTTERVSVDSSGTQANDSCSEPWISADGRYVAFGSYATNLVLGDTNGASDAFIRDCLSGVTECVSLASNGVQGNNHSRGVSISADGRFVVIESAATNLISGDTNNVADVFVRDRQNGTTECVSVNSGGVQGNGISEGASISADGRYVAFVSQATNLVAGDTNGYADIFVHDRQSGITERVSLSVSGGQANYLSYSPSISADGQYVGFASYAWNLVTGDTNGYTDYFVRNRQAQATERVSVDSYGAQGNFFCGQDRPSLSLDGRFVAFGSRASNLVPGDTNGSLDIFLRDRTPDCNGNGIDDGQDIQLGTSVDCNANGIPDECDLAVWDCDANGVVDSCDVALHPWIDCDLNGAVDACELAARDCNANGVLDSCDVAANPSLDCNGSGLPDSCELAVGDCNSNGLLDSCEIASNPLLDLNHNGILDQCENPGTPYCFGDASGHACPCDPGQMGSPGHGCANSTGEGAILSASGSASVTGDSLQLHVASMPNPSSVLFFQGTVQQGSGLGTFNGDGLLCVNGPGGNLIRLGIHAGQPGSSSYGYGVGNDPLISVRGQIPLIGGTRYYQAWYRDNTAFCTGATFNFSNGVAVTWVP